MKKIILVLVLVFLFFGKLDTFATDACDRLVPQYAKFIWKATMASNLRSYPCVYKSTVHGASKVWDIYEIISKVDWWYQIKISDWTIYRIWDRAISKTSEIVVEEEPINEPIKENIEQNTGYTLNLKDKVLVNKFVYKMNKVIQIKWLSYRNALALKISDFIDNWDYSDRLVAILDEIIEQIINIEMISEQGKTEKNIESVSEGKNIEVHTYYLKDIDISKVKNTWIWWYNAVRKEEWVNYYSYDPKLESTALNWSKIAKSRWEISHKRNTWDVYYDYDKITSWFKYRWVVCKNIYRATHTENIWYWSFKCSDGECSDELIASIRSTFDFYMSEKWTSNDAHYRSIIHKYFTKMWLWITIEDRGSWYYKYYLTVHYCTELID